MYDLLLRGGTVVDGSGAPGFRADVAVTGKRITAVGRLNEVQAKRVVNAEGLTIAPGFIDVHSHSDFSCLLHPRGISSLSQGITTEVVGNCGWSPAPYRPEMLEVMHRRFYDRSLGPGSAELLPWSWRTFGEFLDTVAAKGTGINRAFLVGHGTVRGMVLGLERRPATPEEIRKMQDLVREALESGAFGMSTGLEYMPGRFAETEEVAKVARVLQPFERLYTSHMRNESTFVEGAVEEIFQIARTADIRIHVSHHNVVGRTNRGLLTKTMARIEHAEREGVDVSLDYCHFQPFYHPLPLHAVAPGWQDEPDYGRVKKRLATQGGREAVRRAYTEGWKSDLELNFPDAGWDYTILWGPGVEEYVGDSIVELAHERGREPLEVCYELILQSTGPIIVSRVIHEDDTRAVLMSPRTMLSTDTYALDAPLPAHITLHPRNYGAYACFFGTYVRDRKWMTLEEAVRRCTSLPASRFGLRDRGRILEGMAADVTLFSPDEIVDRSTVTEPTRLCDGVVAVVVNGVLAWERGRLVEGKAGEVLRR